MSDFDTAINYVLGIEGGMSDDPDDHGGETNFGITQGLLDKVMPGTQVSQLTEVTAKQVYKQVFWDFLKLDQVSSQMIATAILDTAVNMNPVEAVKEAQAASGFTSFDGIMGPQTIAALNAIQNPVLWLQQFMSHRVMTYLLIVNNDETQQKFLLGWLLRAVKMVILLQA